MILIAEYYSILFRYNNLVNQTTIVGRLACL